MHFLAPYFVCFISVTLNFWTLSWALGSKVHSILNPDTVGLCTWVWFLHPSPNSCFLWHITQNRICGWLLTVFPLFCCSCFCLKVCVSFPTGSLLFSSLQWSSNEASPVAQDQECGLHCCHHSPWSRGCCFVDTWPSHVLERFKHPISDLVPFTLLE